MTDYCTCRGYEKLECTFENCPVYLYQDCYNSVRERCLNSEHEGLDLPLFDSSKPTTEEK